MESNFFSSVLRYEYKVENSKELIDHLLAA